MSGAVAGSWLHRGGNLIDLTVGGAPFNGVTFSAQSAAGVSIWGDRASD